jgi:hypothetical protein
MMRGRRATFPLADKAKVDSPVLSVPMLRFSVPLRGGGEALVDLADWPRPRLAASFGALLHEAWQPLGALDKTAVHHRIAHLRRFFVFLDQISAPVATIDAITPELIDRYEA